MEGIYQLVRKQGAKIGAYLTRSQDPRLQHNYSSKYIGVYPLAIFCNYTDGT